MEVENIESFIKEIKKPIKKIKLELKKYSIEAIKRAAYYLTDDVYIIINEINDKAIELIFIQKNKEKSLEELILEFFNKLLVAEEELKALKESEEIRKLLSAAVLKDISKSLDFSHTSCGGEKKTIPSIQELRRKIL